MTENLRNDLDWQAFRYIAAEMSPTELAQFEERLAGDQRARDAVSHAMELADAVAVASEEATDSCFGEPARPGTAARTNWGRRLGWTALGAAAALAGVLLWHALPFGFPAAPPVDEGRTAGAAGSAMTDQHDGRFALLWCQTRDEMAQSESQLWPAELPAAPLEDGEEAMGQGDDTRDVLDRMDSMAAQPGDAVEPDELLPSWMLVAVAGELDSVGDNTDTRGEN
jgi:hypothetical protein